MVLGSVNYIVPIIEDPRLQLGSTIGESVDVRMKYKDGLSLNSFVNESKSQFLHVFILHSTVSSYILQAI